MDWTLALDRNHKALLRLVAGLFVLAGIAPGGTAVLFISAAVRTKILRVLLPAESALRRLIMIAARNVKLRTSGRRSGSMPPLSKRSASRDRPPLFRLFDPRKWYAELAKRRAARGPGPSISSFDEERAPSEDQSATPPDPAESAARLCRRLQAILNALKDIPAQARRLARVQSRRRARGEPLCRTEPRRFGLPPGHRWNQAHEVDEILSDCDILVRMKPPDTS